MNLYILFLLLLSLSPHGFDGRFCCGFILAQAKPSTNINNKHTTKRRRYATIVVIQDYKTTKWRDFRIALK